jgi:hypothetical protein
LGKGKDKKKGKERSDKKQGKGKEKKAKKQVLQAVQRAHSLMAVMILAKELGAIMRRESHAPKKEPPIRESREPSSA